MEAHTRKAESHSLSHTRRVGTHFRIVAEFLLEIYHLLPLRRLVFGVLLQDHEVLEHGAF